MNPKEKLAALLKEVRDIAAKAESENRDFTDQERTDIGAKLAEIEAVKDAIKKADEDAALKSRIEAITGAEAEAVNAAALAGAGTGIGKARKSAGHIFTDGEAYKALRAAYPNGVPDSAKGIHLPATPLPGGLKALLGTDEVSALVPADYRGVAQGLFASPLTMRQAITVGTTTSDTVEYARVTTQTSNAAPVATATSAAAIDGTTVTNADGGLKPESALGFTKVTATVRTIAHWLPATKRALSDPAQIRTYIDQFLRDGLEQVVEDQIINGDGTGEEFEGILNTTGVQTQAYVTSPIVTIRKAITKARLYGPVTGVVLSAEDDEAIDLAQDANERFYGNGPFGLGPNTIWGAPRIVSQKLAAGQAIVGDLRTCVLWDREQASVTVSDSHADFFVRNLVAILGELRAAFGILEPRRLVVADLTA